MRASRLIVATPSAAFVIVLSVSAAARGDVRFVAAFESGERVNDGEVRNWARPDDSPTLAGRALFDEQDAIRWLVNTQPPPGQAPAAFIEFFSGDRLPAVVVGYSAGANLPGVPTVPAHLIAAPLVPLKDARNEEVKLLRIRPGMVRRWWIGPYSGPIGPGVSGGEPVVASPLLKPGTGETTDGRQFEFRRLRFAAEGVTLLTASGLERFAFAELGVLQLPPVDPWAAYFDELALLCPRLADRLVQLETTSGIVATTSLARYRPLPFSDSRRPSRWYHLIHPAWSLDAFAVVHNEVRTRCYFSPDRVPLSHVAAISETNASPVHAAWRAQVNRNAYGGPLRCDDREFGWGFGVHGENRLVFPLPPMATGVSTLVGFDHEMEGGLARASIAVRHGPADATEETPLWSSEELRGAQADGRPNSKRKTREPAVESGLLDLTPWLPPTAPASTSVQLVLAVDALADVSGPGVDPLDIRDAVDWLEPELLLDREALRAEVERRFWQALPAIDGWQIAAPEEGQLEEFRPELHGHWDAELGQAADFRHAVRLRGRMVVERRLDIPSLESRMIVSVGRLPDSTPAELSIVADGTTVAARAIDVRYSNDGEPPPLSVQLGSWRGKAIDVRLVVTASGSDDDSLIDWRGIALVEGPEVADSEGAPPRTPLEQAAALIPELPHLQATGREKELHNRWLELRVMLAEQLDDDACKLLAEMPPELLLAPLDDPDDASVKTTLAELLPALTADAPGLAVRMRERYAGVSDLRFERAIAAGDPLRVRMISVQFPGTMAAARAHAWLGDRALSRGEFVAAAALYRRALPDVPPSQRRQVTTRLELAESLE